MPGEPLMCVWHTVAATVDNFKGDVLHKADLQFIVEKLNKLQHIDYDKNKFDETFTDTEVSTN